MTGREYLEQYRAAVLEIARLSEKEIGIYERATSTTSHLSFAPGRGSHDEHSVLDALAAVTEQEAQKLKDALTLKIEIEKFVDMIPGDLNRQILRLRYIELCGWPEVRDRLEAAGVPYEERGLFYRHRSAITEANKLYKELYEEDTDNEVCGTDDGGGESAVER